jgi:hypothetical protein
MSVTLDRSLLEHAQKTTGIKVKRKVLEEGLQELIRKYKKMEAIRHAGSIEMMLSLRELQKMRGHK